MQKKKRPSTLILIIGILILAVGAVFLIFNKNYLISDSFSSISFSIKSSITITYPNGGESFTAGSTQNIKWTSAGNPSTANVKISLYKGGVLSQIITPSTANMPIFLWKIPATLTAGSDYNIRISDAKNPNTFDASDKYFSITKPVVCTPSWQCSAWTTCANSKQTRTCTDLNGCGVATGKPVVSQKCTITSADLPSTWDWRNHNGKNYLTSVKAQKNQECAYFSILGALEAEARAFYNNPSINIDLSEAYFQACSMKGWLPGDIDEAKAYIIKNSIPPEQFFPYYDSSGNKIIYNDINCQKNKNEWIKTAWGVKSFISVKSDEVDIKEALIKYGPLVAGMKTCTGFGDFKGTFYSCDPSRSTGNHAVVIVGFGVENSKTYWICKNSFGVNWGDNGYFKIFYDDADIGYMVYAIAEPIPPSSIAKVCEDADNDGFCNWGLGAKPATCPSSCNLQEDCDDLNPKLGPSDANLNCVAIR